MVNKDVYITLYLSVCRALQVRPVDDSLEDVKSGKDVMCLLRL